MRLFFLLLLVSFSASAQMPGIIAASSNYRGATNPPPVNITPAAISGTPDVGHFITATPGSYSGSPTVIGNWQRDGVDIPNQTGLVYLLENADDGAVISYNETATNAYGTIQTESNELQINDLMVYWFNTANLNTMIQQTYVGTNADTPVTADGQVVGSINSLGYGALAGRISANSSQPTLGSDGTINSYVTFTSTARPYTCWGQTASYFSILSDANPVFSIQMYVNPTADGTTRDLITTKTGASSTLGFRMGLNSSNQVFLQLGDGSALVLSHNSTATVTAAGGWYYIGVDFPGAGNTGTLYVNGNTSTFTVPTGADGTPAATLSVGSSNLSLAHVKIRNRVLTTAEKSEYENFTYNPTRNSDPYLILRWRLNFADEAYRDTGLTDPAEDGEQVRAIRNDIGTSPGGVLTRTCESADDASSPIYAIGQWWPGVGSCTWDGDDIKEFVLSQSFFPERSGRWVYVAIGKNDDPDFGSHLSSGGNYMVWTGPDYAGIIGPDYVTIHDNTGGSPSAIALANPNNAKNQSIVVRNAGAVDIWTGDHTSASGTSSQPFENNSIGKRWSSLSADWAMDGQQVLQEVYMGVADDDWLSDQIDRYNETWHINDFAYVEFPDPPTLTDTHTLVQATTGTGIQIGDTGAKQNFLVSGNYSFMQFNVVNDDNYALRSLDVTSPATWSKIGSPSPQDYAIDEVNAAHGYSFYNLWFRDADNLIKKRPFDTLGVLSPILFRNCIFTDAGFGGILINQSISGLAYGKLNVEFCSFTGGGAERIYAGSTGSSTTLYRDTTTVTHLYSDSSRREVVQLNNHRYVKVSNVTGRNVGIVLEDPDAGIGQKNGFQCQGCGGGYIKNSIFESVAPGMIASTSLDLINNTIEWSTTNRQLYLQDLVGNGYAYKNVDDDTVKIIGNDFICAGYTLNNVIRIQEDDLVVVIMNNRFPPSATNIYTCDGPCPTVITSGNTFDSDDCPPVTYGDHPDPNYAPYWKVVTSEYHINKGRGALTPEP